MTEIAFDQVTKIYADGTRAVSAVDLVVPDGKFAVLVGPSGCGKTTLLRMVAGLEQITGGIISIGDRVVNNLPPKQRDIAMVFQNYALYPHMSAYENMAFSLKLRRVRKSETERRVGSAASALALLDQLPKKPKNLSGGQRQRVAMGRAIVREPQAFLMDEPLSNLDAKLRVHMRSEIRRLQREVGVTTIYVTHDQTEAMTLGDLVAVMRQGVLQQLAEPTTLYRRPANLFVAGFIGSPAMNLVEAVVTVDRGAAFVNFGSNRVRIDDDLLAARPAVLNYANWKVLLGIRPEHIEDAQLLHEAPADRRISIVPEMREELGSETYVYFTVDAPPVVTDDIKELAADTDAAAVADLREYSAGRRTPMVARMDANTRIREGERADAFINTRELHFFDPETGQAIYAEGSPKRQTAQAGRTGAPRS
jgi:multiple sugar transport system ATP-binding protein